MAYDDNNENLYRGVGYVSHMLFGYHRSPATWRRGPHVRWAVATNNMNPAYFSLAATALKPQQNTHVYTYFP